ncbi:MAG: hypothetical protein GY811_25520 [Myxococcales bacterium]|nr:hypothetical protein [Myxococcales bacterium]
MGVFAVGILVALATPILQGLVPLSGPIIMNLRLPFMFLPSRLYALAPAGLVAVAAALAVTACGPKAQYIEGTKIERSGENQRIISRVEEYRTAVEEKDAASLLLMASREYWEDGGTPDGEDDYGFAGLKEVITSRFQQAESIRYSMRYKRIRMAHGSTQGVRRAFVDVLVDASFTIPDARGGLRRADLRDQGQLVLEWDGEKWMFLSGM